MDVASLLVGTMDIVIGAAVILMARPLARGEVKMNRWYGARLRQSFESDEKWEDINRFGGRQLCVWSSIILAGGLVALLFDLEGHEGLLFLFAMLPILLLIPAFRTVVYARRS